MARIHKVDVNVDLLKSKGFKSLEDLKKEPEHIFEHLNSSDQDAAYAELWEKHLAPAQPTPPAPPKPTPPADKTTA